MLKRFLRIQGCVYKSFSQLSIGSSVKLECFSSSSLHPTQRISTKKVGFPYGKLYTSSNEFVEYNAKSLSAISSPPNRQYNDEPVSALDKKAGSISINLEKFTEILGAKFGITEGDVARMMTSGFKFQKMPTSRFNTIIDLLIEYGISKGTLIENPWIFNIRPNLLSQKFSYLERIVFRDFDDLIPLLKISSIRLDLICSRMVDEKNVVSNGNRIYYLSDILGVEPRIISKLMTKRLFMLEMPLETLSNNLKVMIEFGVAPANILRDLWVFRYNTSSIRTRLDRARAAQKNKLMPWMVRCPDSILQKSLQLSVDAKAILGASSSTIDYLSQRLGFDFQTTKAIMEKHPAVFNVRPTKVKEILDYLLDEAGFSRHEIACVPRILCHSLATTKKRIAELKSYGCRPASLVIVCKSKREYDIFLTTWLKRRTAAKLAS